MQASGASWYANVNSHIDLTDAEFAAKLQLPDRFNDRLPQLNFNLPDLTNLTGLFVMVSTTP